MWGEYLVYTCGSGFGVTRLFWQQAVPRHPCPFKILPCSWAWKTRGGKSLPGLWSTVRSCLEFSLVLFLLSVWNLWWHGSSLPALHHSVDYWLFVFPMNQLLLHWFSLLILYSLLSWCWCWSLFIPFFYFPLVLIHSSFKKIPKVKNSVIDLNLGVFSKEAPSSVDLSLVFYFVGC